LVLLYWYTVMHGHYTDILGCTVTILIYCDARSLYWYTAMHGHYTDILWCTVTILIYCDARPLYWYTVMHGHYTDILWCTVAILIYCDARSTEHFVLWSIGYILELEIQLFMLCKACIFTCIATCIFTCIVTCIFTCIVRTKWETRAIPNGRSVKSVGLRPLACCDRGFESHRRHGCVLCVR
jgi:hypothetical protein